MNLDGRAILITGAAGFVGRHLASALDSGGARVHGTGIDGPGPGAPFVSWQVADIRDLEVLRAVVAAVVPDAVVHLAGQSSAGRSFEQPIETFQINALGTWNLLEAVRHEAPRARVLAIGSADVYGSLPAGTRAAEDSPLRPVSPYGLSKAAADAFAELAFKQHGLDVIRTRSFAHTGPGQEARFAIPSWAEQIARIEKGLPESVLRVGNLEVTRDLLDVRDVVKAYLALLEQGRSGAAYNVCRGTGVRLSDVIRMLVERAHIPITIEVDTSRVRPADLEHLVGDPSAIERDTGWRAEIPLERTLDHVLGERRGAVDGS